MPGLEVDEAKKSDRVHETHLESKNKLLKTKLKDQEEENIHYRTFAGKKANYESSRKIKSDNTNNSNNLGAKIKDDLSNKNPSWRTCDYRSLPTWLQTNSYILKGYRPPLPSFKECFFTIFRFHTETVNIWTHLLGCLLFIALFLHTTLSSLPVQDKLVLSPFFLGAILCFGLSSTFHILLCHSEYVMKIFSRLDFCGIILLIVGSFIPWLYYGFVCNNTAKNLYLIGIVTLGACVTVFSLSETFGKPLYRPLRATVFVVLGLSGVIPAVHVILTDGWTIFISMGTPLLIMGFFNIAGAFVYATHIPEKIFPGKYDLLFQSHQIFHVLVLLGTVIDYFGIVRLSVFIQFVSKDPDFCMKKELYYGIKVTWVQWV